MDLDAGVRTFPREGLVKVDPGDVTKDVDEDRNDV
jgi:hypothetical protein